MLIQIKNRYNGEVMYKREAKSIHEMVQELIAEKADLADAEYLGIPIAPAIIIINGSYPVLIMTGYIKIGCQLHSIKEWASFEDSDLRRISGCCLPMTGRFQLNAIIRLAMSVSPKERVRNAVCHDTYR